MIELFETDFKDDGRTSSKGNQLKWKRGNAWYKADYAGYEGLAEYIVSHLLMKSSLSGDEFALYEIEEIIYKNQLFNGCRSTDFAGGNQEITLERLFRNMYGQSLNAALYSIEDNKRRLEFLVNQVERITGIKDFGIYMSKLITIDTFFLNEDRHTHNISVLAYLDGGYGLCPIYDNGAGLLSDTTLEYPLGEDIYDLIGAVHPKTFCNDFNEQLDIAEDLYGSNISFYFGYKDVHDLLDNAKQYDEKIRERVETVVLEQMRRYGYLFKGR